MPGCRKSIKNSSSSTDSKLIIFLEIDDPSITEIFRKNLKNEKSRRILKFSSIFYYRKSYWKSQIFDFFENYDFWKIMIFNRIPYSKKSMTFSRFFEIFQKIRFFLKFSVMLGSSISKKKNHLGISWTTRVFNTFSTSGQLFYWLNS